MPFPLISGVTYQVYTPGTDSHNAPIDVWSDPQPTPVHGWAPTTTEQPIDGNRRPSEIVMDLYAPKGTPNGPRWRWILHENTFEQVGIADDFSTGPWRPDAGMRINLRRVDG